MYALRYSRGELDGEVECRSRTEHTPSSFVCLAAATTASSKLLTDGHGSRSRSWRWVSIVHPRLRARRDAIHPALLFVCVFAACEKEEKLLFDRHWRTASVENEGTRITATLVRTGREKHNDTYSSCSESCAVGSSEAHVWAWAGLGRQLSDPDAHRRLPLRFCLRPPSPPTGDIQATRCSSLLVVVVVVVVVVSAMATDSRSLAVVPENSLLTSKMPV